MAKAPGAFVKQTREILDHFYDYAYLLQHPLGVWVKDVQSGVVGGRYA